MILKTWSAHWWWSFLGSIDIPRSQRPKYRWQYHEQNVSSFFHIIFTPPAISRRVWICGRDANYYSLRTLWDVLHDPEALYFHPISISSVRKRSFQMQRTVVDEWNVFDKCWHAQHTNHYSFPSDRPTVVAPFNVLASGFFDDSLINGSGNFNIVSIAWAPVSTVISLLLLVLLVYGLTVWVTQNYVVTMYHRPLNLVNAIRWNLMTLIYGSGTKARKKKWSHRIPSHTHTQSDWPLRARWIHGQPFRFRSNSILWPDGGGDGTNKKCHFFRPLLREIN